MKKPAKKDAKKTGKKSAKENGFTDSIRQTPRPIPDPRKVEHFMSDEGERMTRVDYGPLSDPVLVSADKLMAYARMSLAYLIERNPWHFLAPWLETPNGDFVKFWACYKSEIAENGRRNAVNGSKHCNRTNEQNLLNVVHEYKALSLQQYGFHLGKDEIPSILASAGLSEDARLTAMITLKERMANWVLESVWNDPEAPKRLHEILKNKTAVTSEYSEQPTINARIFSAFVQEITENWSLPTKQAVRHRAGLGDANRDTSAAGRAYGEIGLSALPEA
jgi:hypothetical protein